MFELQTIYDLLAARPKEEIARICAFILAPGMVLGLTISGSFGGLEALERPQPLAVSELRSAVTPSGEVTSREGFALILEPTQSEFRLELENPTGEVWSSLDDRSARANRDHLMLDDTGFSARGPLLGVTGPVTVVVQSPLPDTVQMPGGTLSIEELALQSRRSAGIVTYALLACIFAFGMAAASAFVSVKPKEHAAS